MPKKKQKQQESCRPKLPRYAAGSVTDEQYNRPAWLLRQVGEEEHPLTQQPTRAGRTGRRMRGPSESKQCAGRQIPESSIVLHIWVQQFSYTKVHLTVSFPSQRCKLSTAAEREKLHLLGSYAGSVFYEVASWDRCTARHGWRREALHLLPHRGQSTEMGEGTTRVRNSSALLNLVEYPGTLSNTTWQHASHHTPGPSPLVRSADRPHQGQEAMSPHGHDLPQA